MLEPGGASRDGCGPAAAGTVSHEPRPLLRYRHLTLAQRVSVLAGRYCGCSRCAVRAARALQRMTVAALMDRAGPGRTRAPLLLVSAGDRHAQRGSRAGFRRAARRGDEARLLRAPRAIRPSFTRRSG